MSNTLLKGIATSDLAELAMELMEKAEEVYAIFNTHPAGRAAANGLELLHILRSEYPLALRPTRTARPSAAGKVDGKLSTHGQAAL